MITIEDKLEMFRKVIFDDIEKKNQEKKQALLKSFETEKDKIISDLKIKEEHILEEAQKRAENVKMGLIAESENEAYFEILRLKSKFSEELCDIVIQKFNALDGELEAYYKTFIESSIKNAVPQIMEWKTIYVKMLDKDLEKYADMIVAKLTDSGYKGSVSFEKAEGDIVGGFIIEDASRRIGMDNSIKNLLSENRGMIANMISQRLDEVIK